MPLKLTVCASITIIPKFARDMLRDRLQPSRAIQRPIRRKEARMIQTTNPQKLLRLAEEYTRRLRNAPQTDGIDGLLTPTWDW
jgi:hypothetical protein